MQINKLVRVGLLERSSSGSVRFVAKYMVTVIYDMILHSKRQDMHKVVYHLVTRCWMGLLLLVAAGRDLHSSSSDNLSNFQPVDVAYCYFIIRRIIL